jgi:hypothetical protein
MRQKDMKLEEIHRRAHSSGLKIHTLRQRVAPTLLSPLSYPISTAAYMHALCRFQRNDTQWDMDMIARRKVYAVQHTSHALNYWNRSTHTSYACMKSLESIIHNVMQKVLESIDRALV